MNSKLSFKPGESQLAIVESVSRSEVSGRDGTGFKSGNSKYSSIHMGTEQHTKDGRINIDPKGSIKEYLHDESGEADQKEEYEVQLASIGDSRNSIKEPKSPKQTSD